MMNMPWRIVSCETSPVMVRSRWLVAQVERHEAQYSAKHEEVPVQSLIAQRRLVVVRSVEVAKGLEGWINVAQLFFRHDTGRYALEEEEWPQTILVKQARHCIENVEAIDGGERMMIFA